MRVLVVYAHPSEASFTSRLYKTVCETLQVGGHEVDALDLYAERFDPAMSRHMYEHYLDTDLNRIEVAGYVERLLAAEALVFIFPVWHDGLPAMMKGFIDRVFLPGVIFKVDAHHNFSPQLHNVRLLAAVCTYGAHRSRSTIVGDLTRRFFYRNLRTLVRPDAMIAYLAEYGLDFATPEQKVRFAARVKRAVRRW